MTTSLVPITVLSCYPRKGVLVNLPAKMAQCTPDFKEAILHLVDDVKVAGGELRLSDLFRTYEMQVQAHLDYKEGRKTAYSPPPGASLHEAGRAMDIDLAGITALGTGNTYLEKFWDMASKYGVIPIISKPDPTASEAWHFELRGEFQRVRNTLGYAQMVRAAILDIGVPVRGVRDQEAAWVQGQLTAAGYNLGTIDGIVGKKTKAAIRDVKTRFGKYHDASTIALESIDSWLMAFLTSTTTKLV